MAAEKEKNLVANLADHDSSVTVGSKKTRLIVIAAVVLAAGALTYTMFSLARVECSLCIDFNGQRQCSKAYGPDQRAAAEEAHRNACAIVAHGVTDSVKCGQTPAKDQACSARQ